MNKKKPIAGGIIVLIGLSAIAFNSQLVSFVGTKELASQRGEDWYYEVYKTLSPSLMAEWKSAVIAAGAVICVGGAWILWAARKSAQKDGPVSS